MLWQWLAAAAGLSGLVALLIARKASAADESFYFSNESAAEIDDGITDESTTDQDQEALARMLASEDKKSASIRVIIAWIAYTKAQNAGKSIYLLLTRGDGYGPQLRDHKPYYASTSQEPRQEDLDLAADIINGNAAPSANVQQHGPGGWYERGILAKQTKKTMTPSMEDAHMLLKQWEWSEGIYARVLGSNWYLYSRRSPLLAAGLCSALGLAIRSKDEAAITAAWANLAAISSQTLDLVPVIQG